MEIVLGEKFIDLFLVLKKAEMKKTFKISDNHASELFFGRSATTKVWLHKFTNTKGGTRSVPPFVQIPQNLKQK
jgi:hypothetical protein